MKVFDGPFFEIVVFFVAEFPPTENSNAFDEFVIGRLTGTSLDDEISEIFDLTLLKKSKEFSFTFEKVSDIFSFISEELIELSSSEDTTFFFVGLYLYQR